MKTYLCLTIKEKGRDATYTGQKLTVERVSLERYGDQSPEVLVKASPAGDPENTVNLLFPDYEWRNLVEAFSALYKGDVKQATVPPASALDAALDAIREASARDTGVLPLTRESLQLAWLRGYTAARETTLREWRAELERRS